MFVNVDPSPLVYVIVALETDAVTSNEPVLTVPPPPPDPVFTVKLNVEPSPLVKVSVFEFTLPVTINDPVLTVPPPPAFKAKEAVSA